MERVYMNAENIGKYLKKLRVKHNYTQEDLAEKLHITRQAISSWENGRFIPDIEKIYDLANLYDLTIEEIYAGGNLKSPHKSNEIFINKINIQKRKYIITLLITIFTFLLSFFIYYFLNSYKKTRVYSINTNNNSFELAGNILKINRTIYFDLMVYNSNTSYICLYYNDLEILCPKGTKTIKFQEKLGTDKYILTKDFNDYINNLYIGTDNSKIKLDVNETFVNDELIFNNNNSSNGSDSKKDCDIYIEVPKYIRDNFKYNPDKELYYSSENYQDNNYNIQYNVNKGIITILNNNNNTVKIWQYSLKDKAFIIYMKIIKNEIISNYDESQIKNLSKEEYNNSFRTILNYLDNIIK